MDLLQIAKPATVENAVIVLHPSDQIAIARVTLQSGQQVRSIVVREPIPAGHKVAIEDLAQDELIRRYGQVIGRARTPIAAGSHVHTHNLAYEDFAAEYEFPATDPEPISFRKNVPVFLGYPRTDGRAGTRNYIAVVAASNCASHTAELIASSYENLPPNVDGVVAFPHSEGCGHSIGPDTEQLTRTLTGVLHHPNVSSAVILGLGCEVNQIDPYLGSDRVVGLTLQSSGGTRGAFDAARQAIARMIDRAAAEERTQIPASKIILGLNCGGSDSFSGVSANPALGACCDILAEIGATFALAETTEIVGAEHLLLRRARNREIGERLLAMVRGYRGYLDRFGASFDDNPTPGNKAGGITTILEKSLGAAAKAGTTPLNEVVDYAERIHGPGFVFMNTPGYDPISLTGLAAGGCNLIAFTTGRGSAIGFPTIPVLKIATNTPLFRRMGDNMDVNAGPIADGEASIAAVGQEIFDALLRVASGERTASERLGHQEFVPWRIGPVL